MVKLSSITDNTCGTIYNALQSVGDWPCGSSQYCIAVVNTGGYEHVDKCGRWLRVKWSSDTSGLTQPIKSCCGMRHIGHVTLQTQVRWNCHPKQADIILHRDSVCPELERWTTAGQRGMAVTRYIGWLCTGLGNRQLFCIVFLLCIFHHTANFNWEHTFEEYTSYLYHSLTVPWIVHRYTL